MDRTLGQAVTRRQGPIRPSSPYRPGVGGGQGQRQGALARRLAGSVEVFERCRHADAAATGPHTLKMMSLHKHRRVHAAP
jgi:hypothetical protein